MSRIKNIAEIVSKINKKFGMNTAAYGENIHFNCHRIPTGSVMMDIATGGGIPAGRVNIFWGEESSGKTTQALRIAGFVQKMCTKCYTFIENEINKKTGEIKKQNCKCKELREGIVAVIDIEGTFDEEWAQAVGLDISKIILSRPETGNEVVDIIEAFIRSGDVDFIVLDSIAAASPLEEVGKSAEDPIVGKGAITMNRGWRVWNAAQNDVENKTGLRPTLVVINQIRFKVGVLFGSNETRPGGNGQHFAASLESRMKRAKPVTSKVKDKDGNEFISPVVTCVGKVNKNKTARAHLEFEYTMAVAPFNDGKNSYSKGEIIESKQVSTLAHKVGLMGKNEEGEYFFKKEKFKKQGDMIDKYIKDKAGLNIVKEELRRMIADGEIK